MQNGRSENGLYHETDIIETTDEDGQIHIFEKVSELEVGGQDYALLIYKGTGDEEGADVEKEEGHDEEVVVMRISQEEGLEVYEAIEDETEFERVVAFIENMDDEDSPVSIDISEFTTGLKGEEEEE
jgi:hypothetical protein